MKTELEIRVRCNSGGQSARAAESGCCYILGNDCRQSAAARLLTASRGVWRVEGGNIIFQEEFVTRIY